MFYSTFKAHGWDARHGHDPVIGITRHPARGAGGADAGCPVVGVAAPHTL